MVEPWKYKLQAIDEFFYVDVSYTKIFTTVETYFLAFILFLND